MCPQPRIGSVALNEFSPRERDLLILLARRAILSRLEGTEIPEITPTSHLAEPRGVFTTVYVRGKLRGCVGNIAPTSSLYRTVVETARAAAFEDSRFPPITPEDADNLEISLSILSPIFAIQPDEIDIGIHGLLLSQGKYRGLLLPQVPVEQGWDRRTFLEQTCQKAGLPPDAWQHGARIEAFTAEVFGDHTTRD